MTKTLENIANQLKSGEGFVMSIERSPDETPIHMQLHTKNTCPQFSPYMGSATGTEIIASKIKLEYAINKSSNKLTIRTGNEREHYGSAISIPLNSQDANSITFEETFKGEYLSIPLSCEGFKDFIFEMYISNY